MNGPETGVPNQQGDDGEPEREEEEYCSLCNICDRCGDVFHFCACY